jgi:hypothetical protein
MEQTVFYALLTLRIEVIRDHLKSIDFLLSFKLFFEKPYLLLQVYFIKLI